MLTVLSNAEIYAPEPLGSGHVVLGGGRILHLGPDLPAIDDADTEAGDIMSYRVPRWPSDYQYRAWFNSLPAQPTPQSAVSSRRILSGPAR